MPRRYNDGFVHTWLLMLKVRCHALRRVMARLRVLMCHWHWPIRWAGVSALPLLSNHMRLVGKEGRLTTLLVHHLSRDHTIWTLDEHWLSLHHLWRLTLEVSWVVRDLAHHAIPTTRTCTIYSSWRKVLTWRTVCIHESRIWSRRGMDGGGGL